MNFSLNSSTFLRHKLTVKRCSLPPFSNKKTAVLTKGSLALGTADALGSVQFHRSLTSQAPHVSLNNMFKLHAKRSHGRGGYSPTIARRVPFPLGTLSYSTVVKFAEKEDQAEDDVVVVSSRVRAKKSQITRNPISSPSPPAASFVVPPTYLVSKRFNKRLDTLLERAIREHGFAWKDLKSAYPEFANFSRDVLRNRWYKITQADYNYSRITHGQVLQVLEYVAEHGPNWADCSNIVRCGRQYLYETWNRHLFCAVQWVCRDMPQEERETMGPVHPTLRVTQEELRRLIGYFRALVLDPNTGEQNSEKSNVIYDNDRLFPDLKWNPETQDAELLEWVEKYGQYWTEARTAFKFYSPRFLSTRWGKLQGHRKSKFTSPRVDEKDYPLLLSAFDEFKDRFDIWRAVQSKYFPTISRDNLWHSWRSAFDKHRRSTEPWTAAEDTILMNAYEEHGSNLMVWSTRLFSNRNRIDVLKRQNQLAIERGLIAWTLEEVERLGAMKCLYGGQISSYELYEYTVENRGMGRPSALFPGKEIWQVNLKKTELERAKRGEVA